METITLGQIKARRAKIIDPPWFVAGDNAKECGPHKNSGLALVDTGRDNDWTVARLCEWPTAEFIANAPTDIDYLISRCAELEAALRHASASPATVPKCVKCGHEALFSSDDGFCRKPVRTEAAKDKSTAETHADDFTACGCKCQFPTAQEDTGEDK